VSPLESHAWYRAASVRMILDIQAAGIEAFEQWRLRLHDLEERRDLTLGQTVCLYGAPYFAARAAEELALIVALFPDEPGDVLRPSWE
jgi:hypothetical protein